LHLFCTSNLAAFGFIGYLNKKAQVNSWAFFITNLSIP